MLHDSYFTLSFIAKESPCAPQRGVSNLRQNIRQRSGGGDEHRPQCRS